MIDIFKVKKILAKELGVEPSKIGDKDSFCEDLKMDSKQVARLIARVESELKIKFEYTKEYVARANTVEILAYLVKIESDNQIKLDDSVLENETN
ncbi:MAG: acyl carrier protein [Clostridiales bacterium]|nr:acyl carrier protein [Clostridiales bacterium]